MKSNKQLMGINKEKKKDTRRKTIKREKKRPLRRKSDHVAPSTALMAERNSNTKHTKREKKKATKTIVMETTLKEQETKGTRSNKQDT